MFEKLYRAVSLRGLLTLVALVLTFGAFAQSTVNGKVVDENKLPVIGANVIVNGTTQGVATDINGTFTISVNKNAKISVSYLGYKTQEVAVNGRTQIDVQLVPDTNVMEEVVVTGYGSQKKSDLTGAISSVSAKDVAGYKSGSVVEALGGQVAGVQITSTDGTPGAGFDIKVRGIGTVNGDASPLYIVDGFQVDNIDYLSNSDIESIQVLKDASSSAIYGARAANGVVMVTTKSGKVGTPSLSYSGSFTFRKVAKHLDVMNPYQFVNLQQELMDQEEMKIYFRPGNDENGQPYRYQTIDDYIGVGGIDWQDQTFRSTWSQDHNLALTGGNKNTKYSFSFSDFSEDGVFKNSDFEKITAKMRINQRITKHISVDATLNYANTNRSGVGTSADNGRFNMLAQILSARPTGGIRMTDQELLEAAIDPLIEEKEGTVAQVNPVKQAESVNNTKRAEMWTGNLSVNIELAKGLTLRSAGSYSTTNTRYDVFYRNGSKEAYRNGKHPYGQTQMGRDLRWAQFNYLTYKLRKKDHSFEAMLGEEMTYRSSEFVLAASKDFPTDALGNHNLGMGATPDRTTSGFTSSRLISFFTRLNYSYKDRYLFIATLRADGSTVFSEDNKWGFFPSFSAAWRISEENFMKRQDVISNLKLRLGWGTVGNDRINSNLSLNLYDVHHLGMGSSSVSVLQPKHLASNLKWEGSQTLNLGLDLGFLHNRLNFTLDMFQKDTKDLLMAKNLPLVTGFATQWQNVGKIRNRGLELQISSTNFNTRSGFVWRTDFNISFIQNELRQLVSGDNYIETNSGFDSNFKSNDYRASVGSSLGQMWGYEFDGIYQQSDFEVDATTGEYHVKDGVVDMSNRYPKAWGPGCVKYKDINGDGRITPEDRTVIGNGTPKWFGGITNTFAYKGLDLSIMFQFNYGNDVYNATRLYSTQSTMRRANMMAEVADRWTPQNASNSVPKYNGYIQNDIYSRFIEDGSFLRLKNLTIGYTLPKTWTRKVYISKLRVYFTGQNLWLLSDYKGFDPEVSMRASNPMTPSLDWGAYPKSRVFTFGIDVTF